MALIKGSIEQPSPIALGSDNPAVAELLTKYTDIFAGLVFTHANHVTHGMDIIDDTAPPLKPKQYYLSLSKQVEIHKELDIYLEKG